MAKFISGSVGFNGVNLREDVRVIQELLNRVPAASGGPVPPLVPDSIVGPKTIAAIRKFQQQNLGFADGRVDVNNKTIAALNKFDNTPPASAPVLFRHENPVDPLAPFNPADALDGFDPTAAPNPWLLVPLGKANRVRLSGGGSFSLLTDNRQVATVERVIVQGSLGPLQTGIIAVQGRTVGDTFIRVLDGAGTQVARLDVSVRPRRTVTVAFHYVQNANYGTQTRNPGDETAFVQLMNQIYDRQVNLEFRLVSGRRLPINENLGVEINTVGLFTNGEWPRIVRHRNPGARFNVFFVRELESDSDGEPANAAFSTSPTDTVDAMTEIGGNRDCIFEDSAGINIGETLAHEAGHAFGEGDAALANHLMFGTTDARGRKIPKDQALRLNRAAR